MMDYRNKFYIYYTYILLLKNLVWMAAKVKNKEYFLFMSRLNLMQSIMLLTKLWVYNMKQCIDLTVIDYPNKVFSFYLVYSLIALSMNSSIYMTTNTTELLGVQSLTGFFSGMNWSEREVWDMFGVFFIFHSDLSSMLTDYGFSGHPLRKDFPLTGFYEVIYSDKLGSVILNDLELAQSYRAFSGE